MKLSFRDDRGSVITEFTVGISVLSVLMFGILDCSRALYIRHFVAAASTSAARYAMVRGSSAAGTSCSSNSYSCAASATDVDSFIRKDIPPGVSPTKLTVSTTWPGTVPGGAACDSLSGNNSPGCLVKVQVSYSFAFLFPFLPRDAFALSSSSSVTIAR